VAAIVQRPTAVVRPRVESRRVIAGDTAGKLREYDLTSAAGDAPLVAEHDATLPVLACDALPTQRGFVALLQGGELLVLERGERSKRLAANVTAFACGPGAERPFLIWATREGALVLHPLDGHADDEASVTGPIGAIALASDGRRALTASSSEIVLWRIEPGKLGRETQLALPNVEDAVTALAFGPGRDGFVAGTALGQVMRGKISD
jgi:hypothetical protein